MLKKKYTKQKKSKYWHRDGDYLLRKQFEQKQFN